MKLLSRYHGEINYEEKDIIDFQFGIPGFEKLKKFIVIPIQGSPEFSVLHSIEDTEVGLIITCPFIFDKDYEVDLPDFITENLRIEKPEQVALYTTVTLSSSVEKITSNFRAPIVINKVLQFGEQYIMDGGKYDIHYPLFKEVK